MPANKVTAGSRAFNQRQRVWRHNAFSGHTAMMRSQLTDIAASDSTTAEAKRVARLMLLQLDLLAPALKTRIDP
jgi:hypothetical protein